MSSKFKIFVTGDYPWLRKVLEEGGFAVIDRERVLPGEDLSEALKSADLLLLVYREDAQSGRVSHPTAWELEAIVGPRGSKMPVGIPVVFGDISETWRATIAEVSSRKPIILRDSSSIVDQMYGDPAEAATHNRVILLEALHRWRQQTVLSTATAVNPLPTSGSLLQLSRVELINIGCFEQLTVSLDQGWTMILGDNASGKSTLLRSLALGLSSETEAAALISSMPGAMRLHGSPTGKINLELKDPADGAQFRITTTFSPGPKGDERIRKETDPPSNFPWDRLFVCAYSTNRSREGTESHSEYSLVAAVHTLFKDSVSLQNPELVLLREKNGRQRDLEQRLLSIMMLDGAQFEYTGKGPIIKGRWGDQPIQSLSDGYRSTLQWVLDFCAWAIYAGRFGEGGVDGGILLIDELEQHLHPRWQRHIVNRLRQQFPTTQILATTHTPLVAAGVADLESGQIVRLLEDLEGTIEALTIRPGELWGLRADQILTSEAFGLTTSSNAGSETELDRYSALLGLAERSAEEEAEYQDLRIRLREHFSLGETRTEREAEVIVVKVLDELNTNLDKEHLGFETRQMLQELLRPRNEE